MLKVSQLAVSYGQHRALDEAEITVNSGEIVVILGANGAGKSTLLKAVAGICEGQVAGDVTLAGHPLHDLTPDLIVEEGVALVPEGRGIFGDLSVEENLKLGAYPKRAAGEEASNLDRVYALFPKLVERRRQIARTMSGGEQQMVAIGRAIMSSPQVLMLDEPSLGLSPLLCKELFANLGKIKTLGIGVLMVEQNAKQSLAIADRGYLLENAKIVHEDTADALMQSSAVQAAYLGGSAAETPAPTPAAASVKPAEIPAAPVANGFGQQRKNASVLAGADISDLVARAGSAARLPGAPVPAATPTPTQISSPDAAPANADIAAMLREFEIAAERARQPRPAPAARSAPAAAPPTQPEPVTVEVYRAPRIEIYRRQPSGSFERN